MKIYSAGSSLFNFNIGDKLVRTLPFLEEEFGIIDNSWMKDPIEIIEKEIVKGGHLGLNKCYFPDQITIKFKWRFENYKFNDSWAYKTIPNYNEHYKTYFSGWRKIN